MLAFFTRVRASIVTRGRCSVVRLVACVRLSVSNYRGKALNKHNKALTL